MQKILSQFGLSIGSTVLIVGSIPLILAAWRMGVTRVNLLALVSVLMLLTSGLHTYDLTLVLCLVSFLAKVSRGKVLITVPAYVLMLRPENLASVWTTQELDSAMFLGSLHATVGLVLLALLVVLSMRRTYV